MATIVAARRAAFAGRRIAAAALILRLHPGGAGEGSEDREGNGGKSEGTKTHNGIVTELGS